MGSYTYLRGEATIKPELVDAVQQLLKGDVYWHHLPFPESFKQLHAFHLLCLADRHMSIPGSYYNGNRKAPSWDDEITSRLEGTKFIFGMCFKNYSNQQEAFVALLPHLATEWWAEQDWSDASYFIPDPDTPERYLNRWNSHEEGKGAPNVDFQYVLKEAKDDIKEIADVRLKMQIVNGDVWTGESCLAMDTNYLKGAWFLTLAHHYHLELNKHKLEKEQRRAQRATHGLDLLSYLPEALMDRTRLMEPAERNVQDVVSSPYNKHTAFATSPDAPRPNKEAMDTIAKLLEEHNTHSQEATQRTLDNIQPIVTGRLSMGFHNLDEMLNGGIAPGTFMHFSTPAFDSPGFYERAFRSGLGSKSNVGLALALSAIKTLTRKAEEQGEEVNLAPTLDKLFGTELYPHQEATIEFLRDSPPLRHFFVCDSISHMGKTRVHDAIYNYKKSDLWGMEIDATPPAPSEDPSSKDKLQGLAYQHQQRLDAKRDAANPTSRPSKPGAKQKRKQQKASRKRNR